MEKKTLQSSNNKLAEYCEELKKKYDINNKVVFVKIPSFNLDIFEPEVAEKRCYYVYPPTGLQYLASAIGGRDLDVKIIDLNYKLLKEINANSFFDHTKWLSILEDYLENHNPSVIGVSSIFLVERPFFIQTLEYLKNRKKSIVITGGKIPTYEGESLLEKELCHFVCQREGENKINYLFDNLFENKNNPPTPGILFMYKGKIEQTEGERDIVELEGNLINEHSLVHIEYYCQVGSLGPFSRMAGKDNPFAAVIFSRGCQANCRFCNTRDFMGRGVRSRKTKDILDEIEYLHKERKVNFFEILDDDFARYKDKALEVLQEIIDRNLKIIWASSNGLIAKTLDEELMRKMEESGCEGFRVGVESGNSEILKKIRKPGTLKKFREFSKIVQKFPKMFVSDNYILGFPRETFFQMMESYCLSLEMNLDWSTFAVYQHSVNYFGNKREKKESSVAEDFIPTKHVLKGKLVSSEKVLEGVDVFNISKDTVPTREQLSQIWFTFNLTRNFLQNKNLLPGGEPEKFISWTEAIQERYPTHPYITIFLSLAHLLKDNKRKAEEYFGKTRENLKDKYWKNKFNQFKLTEILNNFPKNPKQAQETLKFLNDKYREYSL